MELASCEMQEYFYDSINTLYIAKEKELIEADNYLLETTIDDLEASIKAKKETKFGMNTSPFNESVYDEENYIFIKNVPYTKEQAQSVVEQLCLGKTPKEFQEDLIKDYNIAFAQYMETIAADYPAPNRKDYTSKEQYDKAVLEVEAKKADRIIRETEHSEKVLNVIKRYRPNEDYIVPDMKEFADWMTDYQEQNNGAKPDPNKEPSLIKKNCKAYYGKFLGYNINSKSKFKYSGGSIEMIFGFISDVKKITLKPTTPIMFDMLEWIPIRTSFMLDEERVRINEWEVEKEKRTVGRFLTGNIIDALKIAEARKKQGIITSYKYTKFTSSEGSIRNGVVLKFGDNYIPLKVDEVQTSIPCVNRIFQNAIDNFTCERGGCDYALSMNSGYTERFQAVASRDSQGNPITLVKLIILGEKLKYDAKNKTYKPIERGEKFKSKFFKDDNLKRFIKSNPVQGIKEYPDYSLAKKDLQYFTSEEYLLNDTSDKIGLYNYLDQVGKLSFQFRSGTSSPEDIKFRTDAIKESERDEKTEEREAGDFEYYNIDNYNPEDKNIPYYKSHRKGEYQWIITTSKLLTPIESITFSLHPYNLTEKQMANLFFSKFTPREVIDLKDKVDRIYKGDNNYILVGLEVLKICKEKYGSPNYIFGKLAKSPNVLGEIVYQFINSEEIKLKTTEQEAKEAKKEEVKVEIKPINISNIEDYLILINA